MKNSAPIDRFITALTDFSRPRVFGPWADFDRASDFGPEAPGISRDHLRRYLAERVGRARLLLIAEAAGYQGNKCSGIAMTSERQLAALPSTGSEFFDGTKWRTSRGSVRLTGFTEPTATIVWGKMLEAELQGRDWVNWNTFAWHPQGVTALANRTPTPQELAAGLPALQAFLSLFPKVPIVAVGDKARGALEALGVPVVTAIRHPANGGGPRRSWKASHKCSPAHPHPRPLSRRERGARYRDRIEVPGEHTTTSGPCRKSFSSR